jgi:O-antigen/teichoic acid export membrane protein
MHSLLSKVLFGMIGLLILVLIAVLIAGAPVLEAILGEQWVVDPMMAVFITIAVGVRACISPLSSALITLRRFGVVLTWQVIYFSSAVILFPLMAARLEFKSYVVFYALHELVLYTLYLALIWWSISRKEAL